MRRTLFAILLAGSLAACSSSKHHASAPAASSTAASSTTATGTPPASPPKFAVVLDDKGLTFPPGKTMAGHYVVSFEDRRSSPPPNQHVHLQFVVNGPQLLLLDLPAGTSGAHVLLANMSAEVVSLDPGTTSVVPGMLRPQDEAHRHPVGTGKVTNPFVVYPSPEYPTPVT